jgi:hypothetical protein
MTYVDYDYVTTSVVLISTYIQECVSATVSPDMTPTAKKSQLNRMSQTCRANIHNMSATDVCRLGGVADRH